MRAKRKFKSSDARFFGRWEDGFDGFMVCHLKTGYCWIVYFWFEVLTAIRSKVSDLEEICQFRTCRHKPSRLKCHTTCCWVMVSGSAPFQGSPNGPSGCRKVTMGDTKQGSFSVVQNFGGNHKISFPSLDQIYVIYFWIFPPPPQDYSFKLSGFPIEECNVILVVTGG